MSEVFSKENIRNMLNVELDEKYIELIVDYLYYLINLNLLSEEITVKELLDRINEYLEDVVFFDEDHKINMHGKKFKGVTLDGTDPGKSIIYVRDSLSDEDKELYFYHEFTHFLCKWFDSEKNIQGIVDGKNGGSIINEVIVQYTAERIYNAKYNIIPEKKRYSGKEIRMNTGVGGFSSLKNYQMYDIVVSGFLKMIGVSKDELARKQFVHENGGVLSYLDEKFREKALQIRESGSDLKQFTEFIPTNDNFKNSILYWFNYLYNIDIVLYTGLDDSELDNDDEIVKLKQDVLHSINKEDYELNYRNLESYLYKKYGMNVGSKALQKWLLTHDERYIKLENNIFQELVGYFAIYNSKNYGDNNKKLV